jgi:hypothetical protein
MTTTLRERINTKSLEQLIVIASEQDLSIREVNRLEFGGLPFFYTIRAIDSLEFIGNHLLARRLRNCSSGKRCQSLYCKECRGGIVAAQRNRFFRHLQFIDNPSNQDFRHISSVLGLTPLNAEDPRRLIEQDKNTFDALRRQIKKIDKYRFVEVAYEIELLEPRKLLRSNGCPKKKKQIKQMLEHSDLRSENLLLYVHYHGITNLTAKEIPAVFRKRYLIDGTPVFNHDKQTGLYIQEFRSEHTLEKNLMKLASYPFKTAVAFKHSFEGKDKGNETFTYDELGRLVDVYQAIQKDRYKGLYRSLSNSSTRVSHSNYIGVCGCIGRTKVL